ncbi:unnamed protein product [Rhodiola kirilowii]
MEKELHALESNNTWVFTPLPPGKNAVGSKWILRIKRHANGTIERYKARLVAKGFTQEEGLDYTETFASVVKMTMLRTVLVVAASKHWPLFQLDVDNAFLHDDLDEEVYMAIPPGFYKQEKQQGMVCKNSSKVFMVLIYVDDIVITETSTTLINDVKAFIHSAFWIKDLGQLKYFLGIEVATTNEGIFINQRKYAMDLLSEAELLSCKPSSTPMDIKQKLAISTSAH